MKKYIAICKKAISFYRNLIHFPILGSSRVYYILPFRAVVQYLHHIRVDFPRDSRRALVELWTFGTNIWPISKPFNLIWIPSGKWNIPIGNMVKHLCLLRIFQYLMDYFVNFCFLRCISWWLKTKNQIRIFLFWFWLLSQFRKRKDSLSFFELRRQKTETKKFRFWFLVTGWCNERNTKSQKKSAQSPPFYIVFVKTSKTVWRFWIKSV